MQPSAGQICFIFGAGGHARVVLDALLQSSAQLQLRILDNDAAKHGTNIFDVEIVGGDQIAFGPEANGALFVVGVGGIRSLKRRKEIFDRAVAAGMQPLTVIHPKSVISPYATLAAGAQVLGGAVINCGAEVGTNVVINTGAVVEHDCRIGAHSSVAPRAVLCGGVQVGPESFIGAGAIIRENRILGEQSFVGAGAVVVKNVLPHSLVIGVPAREAGKAGHESP